MKAQFYRGYCGANGNNVQWRLNRSTGVLTISGKGEMYDDAFAGVPWKKLELENLIKRVNIQDGVTNIPCYAFDCCGGITSVTIGNSVTNIGEYAFHGCSSLISITIPDSVLSINMAAFYGCTGLVSVRVGKGLSHIDVCSVGYYLPLSTEYPEYPLSAKVKPFVIYGYKDSAIQKYAKVNNFDFACIDEMLYAGSNYCPVSLSVVQVFTKEYKNTGRSLKEVVGILKRRGYADREILMAIRNVLGEETLSDDILKSDNLNINVLLSLWNGTGNTLSTCITAMSEKGVFEGDILAVVYTLLKDATWNK